MELIKKTVNVEESIYQQLKNKNNMYRVKRITVNFPNGDRLIKKEGFIASDLNELEAEREELRSEYRAESVSFTYEETGGNEIKREN
jgi:hypothetical protein